jgi:hypothetical protein
MLLFRDDFRIGFVISLGELYAEILLKVALEITPLV